MASYATHPFRPIVGNASFCADCPAGSSYGTAHPWHQGHEPVALDTAKLALTRTPTEALWAELRSRRCIPLRQYGGTTIECSTHRKFVNQYTGLCPDGEYSAVALNPDPGTIDWANGYATMDASDLGLRAGNWPEVILVPGPSGSPVAMTPSVRNARDGELTSVEYSALLGGLLLVLAND